MRPTLVLAVLLATIVALTTTPAVAFCRKTTAGGDEAYDATITGKCAGTPSALPLYWDKSCIGVRVTVDPTLASSGKMTAERASAIVASATADWNGVTCNGAQPLAVRVV